MNRVRRTQLYIPGDDLHKIEKGVGLGVDSLILDIEDGVAMAQKDAARHTIAEALQTLDFGRTERLVRINPVDSGFEDGDLAVTLPARPDGFVVPKVERAEHVRWISERIGEMERAKRWPDGGIRLLVLIETAKGIVNLRETAGSDDRLDELIFCACGMAEALVAKGA